MRYDQADGVQIILTGESLKAARREVRKAKAAALVRDGAGRLPARIKAWLETRDFKGPRFNAKGAKVFVAIGAATVNVGVHFNGACTEYVYPLHTVARVRTTAKE